MATFGQEQTQSQSNGISMKYLDYKGGAFVSYNSDLKENETVNLTEFILIKSGYKITGRSESKHSRIFSNEAETPKGPFNIKTASDKATIFNGEYDKATTKDTINDMGGKLALSLTVLANDKLYNITLTGSSFKIVGDFIQQMGNDINKYKIKYTGSESHKKGAISRSTPKFTKWAKITEEEYIAAEMVVQSLTPSE